MIKKYSVDDASNKGVSFTFSRIPGGLCVSGFFNVEKATKIVVPEQVGNLNVIALCESCFSHHMEITEVVLPQKLQYVPEYCFWGCGNLTSVVMPDGVESIGKNAFAYCANLTSISIPGSVKKSNPALFGVAQV